MGEGVTGTEVEVPEDPLDIEHLFQELDGNKDGRLDRRELEAALERVDLPHTQSYLNDLFRQYDADKDGSVDFSEFQQYVEHRERAFRRAFRSLDRDNSGKITVSELQDALAGLGVPVDAAIAGRMVDLIDVDGSSDISFQEFRRFAVLLPQAQISNTEIVLDWLGCASWMDGISNAGIVLDWLDCASWMDGVEQRLGKVPTREPLQRLLAGGIAGAFSRTVTAPFERLRTMMMADYSNRTLLGTAKKMWRSGGFLGLWRGNLVSVVKVIPQSAIQYAVYDTLTKNVMQPSGVSGEASLSNAQRVAAGCMSGMSACVVVFPLETLRTHAAMGNVKLRGAGAYFRMAAAITRAKGIPGLYQGFSMGLASSCAGAGIGFATYEALTVAYRKRMGYAPTPSERGAIAGGAAMITMSLGMPLEVVMRRMQVQDSPGYPRIYQNTADCIRQMYQREGFRSFWRGTLSSYMKVVPSIAATRLCYEMIIGALGIGGVRRYRIQEQG